MNTLNPYTDDLEKQLNSHTSLLTKKQHDINGSMTIEQESQNSAVVQNVAQIMENVHVGKCVFRAS